MGHVGLVCLTVVFFAIASQLPTVTAGKADKKLLTQILNGVEDVDKEVSSAKTLITNNGGKLGLLEDLNRDEMAKLDLIIEAIGNSCVTQEEPCPVGDNWAENSGHCFHFSTGSATWEEARGNCKSLGLGLTPKRYCDLAEIGNPNDLRSDNWLMETIATKGIWRWIGAHSPKENGQWVWAHSGRALPVSFPFWGASEPSGDGWCVVGWGQGNKGRYYLNDLDCNIKGKYVCQLF